MMSNPKIISPRTSVLRNFGGRKLIKSMVFPSILLDRLTHKVSRGRQLFRIAAISQWQ